MPAYLLERHYPDGHVETADFDSEGASWAAGNPFPPEKGTVGLWRIRAVVHDGSPDYFARLIFEAVP